MTEARDGHVKQIIVNVSPHTLVLTHHFIVDYNDAPSIVKSSKSGLIRANEHFKPLKSLINKKQEQSEVFFPSISLN